MPAAASGGSIGLILGGALTEYLDWRWCLYVNDVLAAIVLAGALAFLPKSDRGVGVRLGWPGIAAVVAGLECVVYGFSSAEIRGWTSPITFGMLFGGVLLLAVFAAVERRVAHPLRSRDKSAVRHRHPSPIEPKFGSGLRRHRSILARRHRSPRRTSPRRHVFTWRCISPMRPLFCSP